MKAGYGKSFVLACVASGLFSEMEKKKAAKRREMVPLPFHCRSTELSVTRRCVTDVQRLDHPTIPSAKPLMRAYFFSPSSTSSLHKSAQDKVENGVRNGE